ncbi:AraC family transcriptional regulator [Pseudohaliea sp.]|uniref:helix-turn-helix domain-containing protein n=1 Tax=Pseudohaliea sp. TaxID=2740289 RepID=UPI0032EFE3AF
MSVIPVSGQFELFLSGDEIPRLMFKNSETDSEVAGLPFDLLALFRQLYTLSCSQSLPRCYSMQTKSGVHLLYACSNELFLGVNKSVVPPTMPLSFSCEGLVLLRMRLKGTVQEHWMKTTRVSSSVESSFLGYGGGMISQFYVDQQQGISGVTVAFTPETVREKVSGRLKDAVATLSAALESDQPDAHLFPFAHNAAMLSCAEKLLSLSTDNPAQELMAEALANSLLAEALIAFDSRNESATKKGLRLRESDVVKLGLLRDYLTESPHFGDTLEQLARTYGLNRNKLTLGFKALFGKSIAQYRVGVRMDKARDLLLRNYPVDHVAERVGYTNRSSFTRVFKEYFGVPPSRIRSAPANPIRDSIRTQS